MDTHNIAEANAACAAAFISELAAAGVRHVCISPGSRSTPLAIAADRHPGLSCHVVIDERAAAFLALGIAKATATPVALVSTSGTAPAHWHPAVIEADASATPLLLLSADRPPEAHGRGAPQTVDQRDLFGRAAKESFDAGVPSSVPDVEGWYRHLACRARASAALGRPGPVQVNMAFREPLAAPAADAAITAEWQDTRVWAPEPPRLDAASVDALAGRLSGARGVIFAGWLPATVDAGAVAAAAAALAGVTGWPVLGEITSAIRTAAPSDPSGHVVAHADLIARDAANVRALRPDAVVRTGGWPISTPVAALLSAASGPHVCVDPFNWPDPEGVTTDIVPADPAVTLLSLARAMKERVRADPEWLCAWQDADRRACRRLDASSGDLDELQAARITAASVPAGGSLVLAPSMPLRDSDAAAAVPEHGYRVIANRGANGIDGLVATACGVAIGTGRPTVCLLGDVALAHDVASLHLAAGLPLTFVVIANGGGAIFSFLPQARLPLGATFERLFTTPPQSGPGEAARFAGFGHRAVSTTAALRTALADVGTRRHPVLVEVASGITATREAHERLWSNVADCASDHS